ncbi:MAG: pseudaminic acid synthase [Elusimicrobia bacterium]|nr:pseudaminic acid synthase [Elusimicrobiota bacterium]
MILRDIRIGNQSIGENHIPWIVAEMSANHGQSLEHALSIVDAAAKAGVQALKLQTYKAETMTLDLSTSDFMIEDPGNIWKGQSLYNLYQMAHCPWEWHEPIFRRCRALGLVGFSTPFDVTAVDFLEDLGVPMYKVASFENNDLPLIRKIGKTGKPLMLSTGMATLNELEEAVSAAREAGCEDIVLLKCTSAYPAPAEEANLATIPDLKERFQCLVGISDHSNGIGISMASVALGARVIERHFIDSRLSGGPDASFSLEPMEMQQLVEESQKIFLAQGKVFYGSTHTEMKSARYRRSLYITEPLKKGDRLTPYNLRSIRPGMGLAPKYLEKVLDLPVERDVSKGTPLTWDIVGGKPPSMKGEA